MAAFAAFRGGLADGARAALIPLFDRIAVASVDTTEEVWSCDSFGGTSGIRRTMAERACGPGAPRVIEPALIHAAVRAIAGERLAGAQPLLAAAAAIPAPMEAAGFGGGGAPDNAGALPLLAYAADASTSALGGPTLLSGGAPSFLTTGGLPASLPPSANPDTPGSPPSLPPGVEPPLETPIPGGLPLMATGAAALYLSRRRKAQAA